MEEEALEFVNDGNGYRTIRKSTWRFGRVPEYGDTLPLWRLQNEVTPLVAGGPKGKIKWVVAW